jgi:diguanylate cyclase (GGDEF)-like protein/PAS domain S-box-containing protein
MSLHLFALDEDLAALNALLEKVGEAAEIGVLVELSWHLRQRDCVRALALAERAEAGMAASQYSLAAMARLQLVRGEIKALFADIEGARALLQAALATFLDANDYVGAGDAEWLLSSAWNEHGDRKARDRELEQALTYYEKAGAPSRVQIARARQLAYTAFTDPGTASVGLSQYFDAAASYDESVQVWVATARANVAALTDDPGGAIKYDLRAYDAAQVTGQMKQALISAVNIAEGFATLGDLTTALDWDERALKLARGTGWPVSIGLCLRQTGETLRLLKRLEEAGPYLREAYETLSVLSGSRSYAAIVSSLGHWALDTGDYKTALERFLEFEQTDSAQSDVELRTKVYRGKATALAHLGQFNNALTWVEKSLKLAREKGNVEEQIQALRVVADLHAGHKQAGREPPALPFLQQALALCEGIEGYVVPADLYSQLAAAHAAVGDYQEAYRNEQAATGARGHSSNEEAQKHALAMQIRYEIDRARADTEHHRALAATLQQTNVTLEALGTIGREITGSLDSSDVFGALYRHAGRLLDVHCFAIYLAHDDVLQQAFCMRGSQIKSDAVVGVPLDSEKSNLARCARDRTEFIVTGQGLADAILPTVQSGLFAPLVVGKRLLGVIAVQSESSRAYGERAQSIIRTLCAYGAIALDNAAAYNVVKAARRKSALQEQELRVAAVAFESQEGMLISDRTQVILRVNSAFTKIMGYTAEDVSGKPSSTFRSVRHPPEFYTALQESVLTTGAWQGEYWALHKDGHIFPLWLSITAVNAEDGSVTHYVFTLIDITERKLAEDEIRSLAFYDSLTNLPNRRLLMDRLRHALAKSERSADMGALIFVDLDNFKKLNDTRGHDVGDMLLAEVARRLSTGLRDGDTVARLGGDEFVILLEGLGRNAVEAAERAEIVAGKILSGLNQVYMLEGSQHFSTPSVGVSLFKGQEATMDEVLKQADLAMYQAKGAGRNTIRFFDPRMQAAVSAHAAMEADFRRALQQGEFFLVYQPQVESSGRVIGAEALVRWLHPEKGTVSPAHFIPLAEEIGLILQLGAWILDAACSQLQIWSRHAPTAHLSLAVNISARQFHDAHFVDLVLTMLDKYRIGAGKLKLELTESLLLKDVDNVVAIMNALKERGVSFSLDDFGTGYSSLSYLKQLPLAQLKIDQSFVRDIFTDSNDVAIVRAIVTLSQSLGLSVIAEGVETREQKEFLIASGCHAFQGYLFGRPGPAEALIEAA